MTDPRYPIGRREAVSTLNAAQRAECIAQIAAAPEQLRRAVQGLDDRKLDTPYRDGGWTVRQVVHHVPDSHMHAYLRCKFLLTEEQPTIKPYNQGDWAETPETRGPVDVSLALLEALHRRWVLLLEALRPEDFARTLNHPENGMMTLDGIVAMYAWHGRHHTAHITSLRERMGWR
ncbi:MAG TPA: putative metal-dependent hydrolase [Gemmatimonadales bacterium]|nr:putative metal-dependent hydrolase [Gemmatimonadales bacterium]